MVHKLSILVIFIVLVGCSPIGKFRTPTNTSNQSSNDPVQVAVDTEIPVKRSIVVYAAASLTGAFKEIGNAFEAATPGAKVSFNFGGSQILRTQLEQGAVADVFASADHKTMDALVSEGLILAGTYHDFATNTLVVILPKENPANIQSLSDLAKPGVKLVLADASVPAGNYARQALGKMDQDPSYGSEYSQKVLANVVSNETDVKQVVAKVELGEADAGIVYNTDALASPALLTIGIPGQFNITVHYPIAVLTDAPNPALAQAFVEYVQSAEGQSILKKWGFGEVTQ